MSIAQSLLPELDMEMAGTRRMLAAIPQERASFKPHPKSWEMIGLATHIANLPTWMTRAIETDEFDLAPPGGLPRAVPGTVAQTLETFDANVRTARARLADASDAKLMEPWTLKKAGAVVRSFPRAVVIRSFFLSHVIHHRGQLSVYLRLADVRVPGVYGPTADDPPM
jgi:uncharacterized damage-inducible protein DinB